ncbi:MAG: hypothetical protein KDJ62_00495 [Rhodobiaceae bacterium]|nr:hypothetical protein [Rhodobiaceae bacterium]MCC0047796.1 hypothetical protein [Rhodobiaceae bacterium]
MSMNNDRMNMPAARSSGAGWFVAGILVALLVGGGLYYVNGGFSSSESVSVELKVPDNIVPGKE